MLVRKREVALLVGIDAEKDMGVQVIVLALDKPLRERARRIELACGEFEPERFVKDFFVARVLGERAAVIKSSALIVALVSGDVAGEIASEKRRSIDGFHFGEALTSRWPD